MEWLNNFFTQEPLSLAVPVVVIITIFVYAARRAHIKHLERIRKINESYHSQISSKSSLHRR